MTPQQEETLKELLTIIPLLVNEKFRRGDKEHGSDIQEMTVEQILSELNEELVDALIYTLVALKKLREIKENVNRNSQHLHKASLRPLPDFPANESLP